MAIFMVGRSVFAATSAKCNSEDSVVSGEEPCTCEDEQPSSSGAEPKAQNGFPGPSPAALVVGSAGVLGTAGTYGLISRWRAGSIVLGIAGPVFVGFAVEWLIDDKEAIHLLLPFIIGTTGLSVYNLALAGDASADERMWVNSAGWGIPPLLGGTLEILFGNYWGRYSSENRDNQALQLKLDIGVGGVYLKGHF